MSEHQNIYQERPVTIFDIHDQTIEILKPESVILKLRDKSRAGATYFDIGALCFSLRKSRLAGRVNGINEAGKITEVVLASKEDWRVCLISSFIEHVRTEIITKAAGTAKNTIKTCLKFFKFCEEYSDFNRRSQTFEGFLSIYRDLTDNLNHRTRLAPNNPISVTRANAATTQRAARRFLQHHFSKTKIDIIKHVPSIIRGKDKTSVVSAPESANRDAFIKFCFALFHELADGILNQDYAPIKLKLPIKGKMVNYAFLDTTSLPKVVINSDLTWPLFPKAEWNRTIKKRWPNADRNLRQQLRQQTSQARLHRSLITPSHALAKAYSLAQSAFIACFYAATGINPIQLTNLKITSETSKTLRGKRFSGLKARAQNTTVYPEFGAHFLTTFNKFMELRTYITNYFGDQDLCFFRPINYLKKLDSERTLFNLKKFIEEHNIDVLVLTPTQIRKGLAVDFLKLSRGDLVITSKKLGNNIHTLVSNYTTNSPLEQSREFSDFYQKMFESAIERSRVNRALIGVSEAAEKDFSTPVGHCSNTHTELPRRLETFTEPAPKPDCSRPETCLFCEHYSIIADKEDIEKLLGLKELIKLIKKNVGVSDQYINIFAPIFYRIDEIIKFLREIHPKTETIIYEVEADIEQGSIHTFWDEHYEFLMELSLQK